MPKFNVWLSRCYQIEIEADNEEEAFDEALSTPLTLWRVDHDDEHGVEPLDDEATKEEAAFRAEYEAMKATKRDRDMAEADGLLGHGASMADRAHMIRMSEKDR